MSALRQREVSQVLDPLALLERARMLAEQLRSHPSSDLLPMQSSQEPGDKGEKPRLAPSSASEPLRSPNEVAIEDPEVAWRVEAMRKQVPARGTIPDLIARDVPREPERCFSCGDTLKGRQRYRCRPCAVAAAIAIWGYCSDDILARLKQDEAS